MSILESLGDFLPVTATGGTASRLLADKLGESVSVLDFASPSLAAKIVLRTATEADAEATSDAIAAALVAYPGNIRLRFPRGLYFLDRTLHLSAVNTWIDGDGFSGNHNQGGISTQDGATQLIATHSSGPVVRVGNMGCAVTNCVTSSTTARRNGAAGQNDGILVDGPDTVGGSAQATFIHRVNIQKQPRHGLVLIGNTTASNVGSFEINNCGGHAVLIDDGTFTSRTNKPRPGQITFVSGRIGRNGGCAFKIGNAADGTNNLPYRIGIEDVDCFYNLQNAATYNADGTVGEIDIWGEDCILQRSAASGTSDLGVYDHACVSVAGKSIRFVAFRFINGHIFAGRFKNPNPSTFNTDEIEIHGGTILHSGQEAGYYNPAFSVADEVRNFSANIDTYVGVVTSLARTDLPGTRLSFRLREMFRGTTESSLASNSPLTMANDTAVVLTFSGTLASGILAISGNTANQQSALLHYRCGDSDRHLAVLAASAELTTGIGGALTGTTGTDSKLNVSVSSAAPPRIWIENRLGGTITVTPTILSPTSPLLSIAVEA